MAARLCRRSYWYWDRRGAGEEEIASRAGIVVVLGWMLSRSKNLAPYTRLYKSCGWDCLVCHPQVFNLFVPSRAIALALSVLEELSKEIEKCPLPVVFAVFSGGPKACLYKIIQILQGKCSEVKIEKERFDRVVRSLSGLMFDSSPLDFVSHLGAKFMSYQVLTFEPGRPITFVSWIAYAVGRGVDIIFSNQLGPQRIDLWQALYSCVNIGPILFLCSENDKLAPVETIQMFASNLQQLGGNVEIVVWKESEHVGHFRRYPDEYSKEVTKLLAKAMSVYTHRLQKSTGPTAVTGLGGSGNAIDFGISLDISSSSWIDLPDLLASEISRVSKLPHIQLKNKPRSDNMSDKNACHGGVELQACLSTATVLGDSSSAKHSLGMRSRL